MTRIFLYPLLLLAVLACVLIPNWNFYFLTGRFFPISDIEKLDRPITITGWTPAGLTLADGRTLPIPGITDLPPESTVLDELTRRGIEITPDGRLIALVRLERTCGNDPVVERIIRINLSNLATFARVGTPARPITDETFMPKDPEHSFSKRGWNVSDYCGYMSWCSLNGIKPE